jgi:hypothetical protein
VGLLTLQRYLIGIEERIDMGRVERDREIARRRTRRVKLQKLRKLYAKADSKGQKDEIVAKIRRISPFAEVESAKK